MIQTLYLGRLHGTRIYIHWTFWLLVILLFLTNLSSGIPQAISVVFFVFVVFACVFLHELGHVYAGRYYGIRTEDVTLLPIGGIARMESIPPNPWIEFVVAIAGPLVNVAIALVLSIFFVAKVQLNPESGLVSLGWTEQLLLTNIGLVLFNLLPVYPMDGGRVLRAILQFFTTRSNAIRWTAKLGQWIAGVLALYGLVTFQLSLFLIFSIMFVVCSFELLQIRVKGSFANSFGGMGTGNSGFPGNSYDGLEPDPSRGENGDVIDAENVRHVR